MKTLVFAIRTALLLQMLVLPTQARCDSVFHPYYPNQNGSSSSSGTSGSGSVSTPSGSESGNVTTTNISINAPLDYSGAVTVSLPIVDSRRNSQVISALERFRKRVSKQYCASITPPGRQTFLLNNRVRRFHLTPELNRFELRLSRTSGDYAGTANVTFHCQLY